MLNPAQSSAIKSSTFSGTSDSTGNIQISNSNIGVIAIIFDASSRTGYAFCYPPQGTYIRVMNNKGDILNSTSVSGTYWYYELPSA